MLKDAMSRAPRYRLKEDHRRTVRGIETIIEAGTDVVAIQEQIHYGKRTHKVQVRHGGEKDPNSILVWIHKKNLSVLR